MYCNIFRLISLYSMRNFCDNRVPGKMQICCWRKRNECAPLMMTYTPLQNLLISRNLDSEKCKQGLWCWGWHWHHCRAEPRELRHCGTSHGGERWVLWVGGWRYLPASLIFLLFLFRTSMFHVIAGDGQDFIFLTHLSSRRVKFIKQSKYSSYYCRLNLIFVLITQKSVGVFVSFMDISQFIFLPLVS